MTKWSSKYLKCNLKIKICYFKSSTIKILSKGSKLLIDYLIGSYITNDYKKKKINKKNKVKQSINT